MKRLIRKANVDELKNALLGATLQGIDCSQGYNDKFGISYNSAVTLSVDLANYDGDIEGDFESAIEDSQVSNYLASIIKSPYHDFIENKNGEHFKSNVTYFYNDSNRDNIIEDVSEVPEEFVQEYLGDCEAMFAQLPEILADVKFEFGDDTLTLELP